MVGGGLGAVVGGGVVAVVVGAGVVAVVGGAVVAVGVCGLWDATGHSRRASWLTVEVPWSRLSISVELTPNPSTVLRKFESSLAAWVQSWAANDWLMLVSWLFSSLAWYAERRPPPLPQAARHRTAKMSPPTLSALFERRIGSLTLAAVVVGNELGA